MATVQIKVARLINQDGTTYGRAVYTPTRSIQEWVAQATYFGISYDDPCEGSSVWNQRRWVNDPHFGKYSHLEWEVVEIEVPDWIRDEEDKNQWYIKLLGLDE